LRTTVTQPTVIMPSDSKPKKRSVSSIGLFTFSLLTSHRSAFARRFSEHVRNSWMYADSY
jgi:hypothetical protein